MDGEPCQQDVENEDDFCTGLTNVTHTCKGDLGGPLVYYNIETKTDELVGLITDDGIGPCKSTMHPDININVTYHFDWIRKQLIHSHFTEINFLE